MKKWKNLLGPEVEDYDLKREIKILKYLRKVSKGKTVFDSNQLFVITGYQTKEELYKLLNCMTKVWHIEGLVFEQTEFSGLQLKNNLSEIKISDVGKEYLSNQSLIAKIFDPIFRVLEIFDFISDFC